MKRTMTLAVLTCMAAAALAQNTMTVEPVYGKVTKYNLSSVKRVYFEDRNYDVVYESVDLGLPSGLEWATCNVGANSPEEFGSLFAWGETWAKDTYEWRTYKWCTDSTGYSLTKYNKNEDFGVVDWKHKLDPEDDVAHVLWGGDWRMPTHEEVAEMLNNTTQAWVTVNGVKGRRFTGSNGNSIFLPAAGRDVGGKYKHIWIGMEGWYWDATRGYEMGSQRSGLCWYFGPGHAFLNVVQRFVGMSVRPVRQKQEATQQ